jgi:microcystin degradation protein MlrC
MSVDSAAAIAAEFESGKGPLIIADYSDNPGAGAYGDSTNLLAALLTAKIRNACFAPIVDAEVALQLQSSTVGDRIPLHLGGKTEPGLGGGPLEVDAELILISNGDYVGKGAMAGGLHASFGPTAVIRVEGIDILVVSISNQILDLEQFRTFGIEPTSKALIGLKSMQHFRADFEPIAGKVIVCDSQSLCTTDYARMNFRKIPRPIFPLDQFEFQPEG